MTWAYYNEIDAAKAEWLRENIKAGLCAPGEVDERSVADVRAEDLRGFRQCHFFAGIGIWSYALRLAGWPDDRPVWTGSCPCQPFSVSGKRDGGADDRHLWPHWARLIRECKPAEVLGEQVEAAVRHGWFDLVSDDLEAAGYAVGAVAFPACSVGAPHIRQRLYFGAYTATAGLQGRTGEASAGRGTIERPERLRATGPSSDPSSSRRDDTREHGSGSPLLSARPVERGATERSADTERDGGRSDFPLGQAQERTADGRDCAVSDLSDTPGERRGEAGESERGRKERDGEPGELGDTYSQRFQRGTKGRLGSQGREITERPIGLSGGNVDARACIREFANHGGATRGFWANCDWWYGRDGRYRPIKPGVSPLAHGAAARVLRLRGYGDGIVAPQAKAFIEAWRDATQ